VAASRGTFDQPHAPQNGFVRRGQNSLAHAEAAQERRASMHLCLPILASMPADSAARRLQAAFRSRCTSARTSPADGEVPD